MDILPPPIREKIILYLDPEGFAKLMIAFPSAAEEWKTDSYLRSRWVAKYPTERNIYHKYLYDRLLGCHYGMVRGEKYRSKCCMCILDPAYLSQNPLYANCFCVSHAKIWMKSMMSMVPVREGSGLFSRLSMPLLVRILDYLTPFQQASLALAFHALSDILQEWSYVWHSSFRFDGLKIPAVERFQKILRACKYRQIHLRNVNFCRRNESSTPSNHCVCCLMNPAQLLVPPAAAGCWCVDHCRLHYKDQVVWNTGDTSEEEATTSEEDD